MNKFVQFNFNQYMNNYKVHMQCHLRLIISCNDCILSSIQLLAHTQAKTKY
jgi:hypothetical protein